MYRAIIILGADSISALFNTEQEAMHWIDANNDNYSSASFVQKLSSDYRVLDSFCYTK